MWELTKSLEGSRRVQVILVAWLPPVLLATYGFLILVVPSLRGTPPVRLLADVAKALNVNKFVFMLVADVVIAAFAFVNRRFLYHVLEGYAWPGWLRSWRVERAHIPQRRWLLVKRYCDAAEYHAQQAERVLAIAKKSGKSAAAIAKAEADLVAPQETAAKWQKEVARADTKRQCRGRSRKYPRPLGWLPRRHRPLGTPRLPAGGDGSWELPYPEDEKDVLPTRVGNALRRMETYGANTFGLDSQIMWYELFSVAPEPLASALDDREVHADTLVSAIYASLVFTAATGATAIWRLTNGEIDFRVWSAAAIGVLAVTGFYHGLLGAVGTWASAVRALVNLGREPLRRKYGLRAPVSHDEEKEMWTALTGSVWYGEEHYSRVLDAFRETKQTVDAGGGVEVGENITNDPIKHKLRGSFWLSFEEPEAPVDGSPSLPVEGG
jgi:hypothetical protein